MKNLFFAMKLEIRACLRQLSSTLTLNAAWRLVLVAFAVLMSAALGYLRLTGMPMEALLAAGFAVSLLAGAIAFNRRNAEMLLSCEKTQALRTLPMDFRILQSVKLEKLLFASTLLYVAIGGYLLAIGLLSGYFNGLLWIHSICALTAFCLALNLRAMLLGVGERLKALKYPVLVILLIGGAWAFRRHPDWMRLLEGFCSFYTRNCPRIALALAAGLILVKGVQLCWRPSAASAAEDEATLGISARMEAILNRTNDVIRRDLRGILHSPKERRAFMGRILFPLLGTWSAAALLRTGILSVSLGGQTALWMLALMVGSGYSSLFERQMTMGFEGDMVIAYILSGSRISDIQTRRLMGSLALVTPIILFVVLIAALILGQGFMETALSLILGATVCASLSSVSAYYLVKGTSYANDLNRPRFSAGIILQIFRTGLEMALLLTLTLLEKLSSGPAQALAVAIYAGVCALLALIYIYKIRKGDRHFYGEYQGIAA